MQMAAGSSAALFVDTLGGFGVEGVVVDKAIELP